MSYDPNIHHRRSLRLKGYDYRQAGAYFLTICTHERACVFGDVMNGVMVLNDAGLLVQDEWHKLVERFPHLFLDAFVVMPNHVHSIIHVGAQFIAPSDMVENAAHSKTADSSAMNRAPTVGNIVRTFKAASTRRVRQGVLDTFAWQRNYYEHIIRNDQALSRIREYITNNPLQWSLDRENPASF